MSWRRRIVRHPSFVLRVVRATASFGLLVLSVCADSSVEAEEPTRSEWTSLAPGLWYRSWSFSPPSDGIAVTAHVFRADPRTVRMTMLDARRGDRAVATAATLRREAGAYLVVNGSFFDENSRPLGLVVGDGEERSAIRNVDQGIFLIADGIPRIQHTRDPLPEKVEMAVQAFPRLVVNGRPLRLKPQASRRTSVCVPGDGTVMIIVVPVPISLADLATNLVLPPASGGLGCWGALNLDGGPSAQLSLATPDMSLDVEGGWPVPNGLAVIPIEAQSRERPPTATTSNAPATATQPKTSPKR